MVTNTDTHTHITEQSMSVEKWFVMVDDVGNVGETDAGLELVCVFVTYYYICLNHSSSQ